MYTGESIQSLADYRKWLKSQQRFKALDQAYRREL
jgi:hypothetical protein